MPPESMSVGVVIATRNRPELLRRAIASVLDQEYPGEIRVAVVFDRSDVEHELETKTATRSVTVMPNARQDGLAGARNTAITWFDTDLVAFCDDDDVWLPGKLAAQVAALERDPAVAFVTTAMEVDYRGERSVRTAGQDEVTIHDLVRSRMSMLHPSSFVFRREAAVGDGGFGLVEERIPHSHGEDWDLLLRAARVHQITHLDAPWIRVQWGASSYFNEAWADKNESYLWMLDHHPEFRSDPRALGVMMGKLAFGAAAVGRRREAVGYAREALRANWREPRTPVALLTVAGVPARRVAAVLNRRGHGI